VQGAPGKNEKIMEKYGLSWTRMKNEIFARDLFFWHANSKTKTDSEKVSNEK